MFTVLNGLVAKSESSSPVQSNSFYKFELLYVSALNRLTITRIPFVTYLKRLTNPTLGTGIGVPAVLIGEMSPLGLLTTDVPLTYGLRLSKFEETHFSHLILSINYHYYYSYFIVIVSCLY